MDPAEVEVSKRSTNSRLKGHQTSSFAQFINMTILSALVLIRALSVFHITLAFYFLTAPHLIADQNIVFILSESMHMVTPLLPIRLHAPTH